MGHKLFFTALMLWLGTESYLFLFYNRKVTKENHDKKSKYLMLVLILLGMYGGQYIDPTVKPAFDADFTALRYLSILFILVGLSVRIISIYQLGKSFSVNVGLAQRSGLKTTGFYKLVRHPSYLGEIIAFLGVSIAFNHPLSSTMALFFSTIAFLYRIKKEEIILIDYYGQDYIEYCRRTKKLIPYLY